jgi:hypothetical protein
MTVFRTQVLVATAVVASLTCAAPGAEYRFDISQSGYDTIKISADDGFVIDDWKDLTIPSCLIAPSGGFTVKDNEALFTTEGVENFRLIGKPFSAAVGATGEAVIELFDNDCTNTGWTWTVVSKP